jgi:diguanylate cyclase (GGDEF)-like protein/PAS domain S-box-containing protein
MNPCHAGGLAASAAAAVGIEPCAPAVLAEVEALELTSDAVVTIDLSPQGQPLHSRCNQRARSFFGIAPAGSGWPRLGGRMALQMRGCVQSRQTVDIDHLSTGKDTEPLPLRTRITPLLDDDGNVRRLIVVSQDRNAELLAQQQRAQYERDLQALTQHTPAPLVRYDRACRRIFVNDAFCAASGIPRELAMGDAPCDNPFIRGHVEVYQRWLLEVMANGRPGEIEIRGADAAGRELIHRWQGVPEFGADGQVQSVLVLGRDITEQRQIERERHVRERLFRTLVENSPDIVSRIDRQLQRIYLNPVATELLNRQALGARPSEGSFLCDPEGYERVLRQVFQTSQETSWQTTYIARDGARRALLLRLMPEFDLDGHVTTLLVIGRDVHDLVEERRRAEQLALTDNLTGLANRTMLIQRLRELQDGQHAYALAILDLDNFKTINDTLGHRSGDDLLAELARRLAAVVGDAGMAARLGGDEFALLLPDCVDPQVLQDMAMRVQEAARQPLALRTRIVTPSVSIGLSTTARDGGAEAGGDALARADLALYDAKHAGRGTFRFWRPELSARLTEQTALEADLRGAADRDELRLHFQPVVSLADDALVGAEALLRWQHPQRGLVMPNTFIPVAEASNLMLELSHWVIEQTCQTAARWNDGTGRPLRIFMNLSPRDFAESGLAARVQDAMDRHGCRGEWLGVEITECLLLGQGQDVEAELQALRMAGISVAIDDFGTGYSALSYLQRLRIDRLKIDRSFVHDVDSDPRQEALVRACIGLGVALGLELVAEGVETMEQADRLRSLGCSMAQGWFYARAMSHDDFVAWRTAFAAAEAGPGPAG